MTKNKLITVSIICINQLLIVYILMWSLRSIEMIVWIPKTQNWSCFGNFFNCWSFTTLVPIHFHGMKTSARTLGKITCSTASQWHIHSFIHSFLGELFFKILKSNKLYCYLVSEVFGVLFICCVHWPLCCVVSWFKHKEAQPSWIWKWKTSF